MYGYLFSDSMKFSPCLIWRDMQTAFASQSGAIFLGKITQALTKIYLCDFFQQRLLLGRLKGGDFAGEIVNGLHG